MVPRLFAYYSLWAEIYSGFCYNGIYCRMVFTFKFIISSFSPLSSSLTSTLSSSLNVPAAILQYSAKVDVSFPSVNTPSFYLFGIFCKSFMAARYLWVEALLSSLQIFLWESIISTLKNSSQNGQARSIVC